MGRLFCVVVSFIARLCVVTEGQKRKNDAAVLYCIHSGKRSPSFVRVLLKQKSSFELFCFSKKRYILRRTVSGVSLGRRQHHVGYLVGYEQLQLAGTLSFWGKPGFEGFLSVFLFDRRRIHKIRLCSFHSGKYTAWFCVRKISGKP